MGDDVPLQNEKTYPFAVVLRLRVLQIVCGISSLLMGTVAFIEERGEFNLGLGIPAGGATVIAAAASIHTSRGFDGYQPSTCMPGSSLRFLGPSVRVAAPLAVLWGMACSLQTALFAQAIRTLSRTPQIELLADDIDAPDQQDLVVLSGIQVFLAVTILATVMVLLRIDCKYDPD